MGFVQCDPERRDLGQTLLFTGPIVGLKSVVDAPASCKIRLQWPFPHFHMFDSPLGLTTDSFYHLSVTIIMTPPGDWPPDSPQEGPAKPKLGQGSRGWWSGSIMLLRWPVRSCWLWDVTLARSPIVGSGAEPRRLKPPTESRGMSIHWLGAKRELCPVQPWPLETRQVSRARLLLLASDPGVKAATLIREGILL